MFKEMQRIRGILLSWSKARYHQANGPMFIDFGLPVGLHSNTCIDSPNALVSDAVRAKVRTLTRILPVDRVRE